MKPLTIFTFGYWGWGNATKKLVQSVDRVEESREFEPPFFVDVRISRSVRAAGFNGESFKLAARHRYEWMSDLGNTAVQTGKGGISIKNPDAVSDLLARAEEDTSRRVIFFCSCEFPGSEWHQDNCHRVTVASLLLKLADERGKAIQVVEWPGDSPADNPAEIEFSGAEARKLRSAKRIRLGQNLPITDLLKLPWASTVRVRWPGGTSSHLVGPAQFRSGCWVLPKIQDEFGNEVSAGPKTRAIQWRKRWSFELRHNGA